MKSIGFNYFCIIKAGLITATEANQVCDAPQRRILPLL
uniref:Uncharacterized protein n=1 Tax=Yersinia enterocolitica W22703 TaxID=913028 RepID=F4N4A4_YEREN|nr:unknown protein [Yersinia enterocolitica W22703]